MLGERPRSQVAAEIGMTTAVPSSIQPHRAYQSLAAGRSLTIKVPLPTRLASFLRRARPRSGDRGDTQSLQPIDVADVPHRLFHDLGALLRRADSVARVDAVRHRHERSLKSPGRAAVKSRAMRVSRPLRSQDDDSGRPQRTVMIMSIYAHIEHLSSL